MTFEIKENGWRSLIYHHSLTGLEGYM